MCADSAILQDGDWSKTYPQSCNMAPTALNSNET